MPGAEDGNGECAGRRHAERMNDKESTTVYRGLSDDSARHGGCKPLVPNYRRRNG